MTQAILPMALLDLNGRHDLPSLRAKLAGRRIVASISGGKDSAAMALYLRELELPFDRVFMDTGWEHEATYEYLRGELARVIGPVTEIRSEIFPDGMVQLVKHKGMFPSRLRRFCTEFLKVKPMLAHLERLVEQGEDVVNAVGIRHEESKPRSELTEWEWSKGFDCETWRPIIRWTEQQVIDIHKRHGLRPNPRYLAGDSRVGCFPCIFARKAEIRRIADAAPERIEVIRQLEAHCADAAQARATAKGEERRFPPPTFFQQSLREADGFRPSSPIDSVVAWSRTKHGGREPELYAAPPGEAGCVRWGLCDTGAEEDDAA